MAESSDFLFILSISHFFKIIILAILLLLVFLLYVQYNIRVLADGGYVDVAISNFFGTYLFLCR